MDMRWVALALALAGCGGNKALEGTCTAATGEVYGNTAVGGSVPTSWSCSSPSGATRTVAQCPTGVQLGGACGDMTVDTTNPNEPAHVAGPTECFACSGNTGTDWSCASNGWESAGAYSCAQ
jgi:hypothetical protein